MLQLQQKNIGKPLPLLDLVSAEQLARGSPKS